jgi:hypothetical protein
VALTKACHINQADDDLLSSIKLTFLGPVKQEQEEKNPSISKLSSSCKSSRRRRRRKVLELTHMPKTKPAYSLIDFCHYHGHKKQETFNNPTKEEEEEEEEEKEDQTKFLSCFTGVALNPKP